MRLRLLLLLSFLLVAPPARADWWDLCDAAWVRVRYGSFEPAPFAPEEAALWKKAFGTDGEFPHLYASLLNEPLFWQVYSELPESIRQRLEGGPPEGPRFRLFGVRLQELTDTSSVSFLGSVLDRWFDQTRGKIPFATWVAKGRAAQALRLAANPPLGVSLKATSDRLKEERRASDFWAKAYEVELPLTSKGNHKYEVRVGDKTFPGIEKDGWIALTVPAARVAHPAWNQISTARLIRMAEQKVEVPSSFEVMVGHDGFFYLRDANHRFALSGKTEVQVVMPFPPKTDSFRNYLDHRGLSQPPLADIVRLYKKEVTVWDLFPYDRRRNQIEPK